MVKEYMNELALPKTHHTAGLTFLNSTKREIYFVWQKVYALVGFILAFNMHMFINKLNIIISRSVVYYTLHNTVQTEL